MATRSADAALIAVFLTSALAASAPRQQPAPGFADLVLGSWDLTVQDAETHPSWLDISLRKETELMARFVGRFGSNRHAAETTYRNGELLVRVPAQYESNTADLVFKGRLTGDRLEGTMGQEGGKPVKWTGVRAPALIRQAPPRWGSPIELVSGTDVAGWRLRNESRGRCWNAVNGALTNTPPCVDLISERRFGDFKLHAEFNIVPKSNSGIYLRGRYEVQINDDAGMAADSLRTGGLYGFLRPSVNAAGKPGAWQTYDITLLGRRVTIVVNGETVLDDAEIPGITGGALDSEEGAPGPLMLQGDHGQVSFRKVTVTPAAN